MNIQRASDILRSNGVINVCYNGVPVWLQGIKGDYAEVCFIGLHQRSMVPISGLVEGDPYH